MKSINNKRNLAYTTLKAMIINISIKPGDFINEDELNRQLNISKTPLREALQKLETEGFVDGVPRKGYFASRISVRDISELFEICEILECEIVKRVSTKIDLKKVETFKSEYESIIENSNRNQQEYFAAWDEVHSLIFKALGNNRLNQFYTIIQEHIQRLRAHLSVEEQTGRVDKTDREHIEILDALIARDPLRAENAIRNHIRNSKENLKKVI